MAYDDDNIFARILRGEATAYSVYEDERTIAFLDVMPQADGHTLVLPRARAENLFDLPPEMAAAVMRTAQQVGRAVQEAFAADGVMLMQLNGAAAGQTVFHFHLHLIPRHADRPLRSHGRGMADGKVLEQHAQRIRAALGRPAGA